MVGYLNEIRCVSSDFGNVKEENQDFGYPISDIDMMIHFMNNVSDEYKATINITKNELEIQTATSEKLIEILK